jgi:hypothetical protein
LESLALQPPIASGIGHARRMLSAIDFDNYFVFKTDKIDDESPEQNLSLELGTGEAMRANSIPQMPLGIGHSHPQLLRV